MSSELCFIVCVDACSALKELVASCTALHIQRRRMRAPLWEIPVRGLLESTCSSSPFSKVNIPSNTHRHTDTHTHTHTRTHTRTHTHTHTHTHTQTHRHTDTDTDTDTHTHTHTHTHTDTHTHTHTHTHTDTCCFLWFTGTLHRRNGFYTVQAVCAIALHLPYT